ncbi:MAG: hypothetical protein HQ557_07200 [Bacteroidetes bacterium]|nr:hypothetical protein [Bacteroidota bacterium]
MDIFKNKLSRMQKTLSCEEPDRVPLFDLFWKEFFDDWKEQKKCDDIYEYYDMDLKLVVPNLDPAIKSYKLIEKGNDYIIFKSGYGCILKKADYSPMPGYIDFQVKDADHYKDFVLENPEDDRRYYEKSANILSSSGDQEVPSFVEQLEKAQNCIPTMGLVLEGQELLTRIRGMEGTFIDIMLEGEKVITFLNRLLEFELKVGLKQIQMGVDFMFIGGDVAYDKGMFYSQDMWRTFFKPFLKTLCYEFRLAKPDIKLIYHNCGNASVIFDDLIDCGIDAIQPLEVKAGLDVVELKKKYKNRLAFIGNIDAQSILPGNYLQIKKALLHNLNAAKGGGYIPMSDHSVPNTVSVSNYDYYISLIKKYGNYPLQLGIYNEEI